MTNNCNHCYFSNIQTDQQAYWLGFLSADGCICGRNREKETTIQITLKDKEHLEKWKLDIECKNPVRPVVINHRTYWTIRHDSALMAQDLSKFGIVPRKSLKLTFPQNIDEHLIPAFIRGYFDGDGCITYSLRKRFKAKINFVGTFHFLNGIKNYFGLDYKICCKGNWFSLDIGGFDTIYRVMSHLYNNASIFLDRKFKKWNEVKLLIEQKQVNREKFIAFNESKTLADWIKDTRCVINYDRALCRIKNLKWSVEEALSTPIRKCG